MKLKTVDIFRSKNEIIIHSYSYTDVGLLMASEPFFNVKDLNDKDLIVNNIKSALLAVKENIPHPKNIDGQVSRYTNALGYTILQLHKKFQCCTIELKDGQLTIIPNENRGNREGWRQLESLKTTVNLNATNDDIYEKLMAMFSLCTIW